MIGNSFSDFLKFERYGTSSVKSIRSNESDKRSAAESEIRDYLSLNRGSLLIDRLNFGRSPGLFEVFPA